MIIFSCCSPLLHSGNPLSQSQSPSLPFIHLPFLGQFVRLHLVSPIVNGSSHCLLFLDVESCQILLKIKALFIQPLNLLHFMTGISSRTSIRLVKHDPLCRGPCSLPSIKWASAGVLLPPLLRLFPRIPQLHPCYP